MRRPEYHFFSPELRIRLSPETETYPLRFAKKSLIADKLARKTSPPRFNLVSKFYEFILIGPQRFPECRLEAIGQIEHECFIKVFLTFEKFVQVPTANSAFWAISFMDTLW